MKRDNTNRSPKLSGIQATAPAQPPAPPTGLARLFSGKFFTRHVREEAAVPASASEVWRWFTAFDSFPNWNPFIRHATGALQVGSQLDIRLRLGSRVIAFQPTVTTVQPAREVRWTTTVLIPGLFDVDRRFHFDPTGTQQTTFTQEETNSGLLVPIAYALAHLERDLRVGFRDFSQALALQTAASKPLASDAAATNGSGRASADVVAPNHVVQH
ncbi:MAG TPA: SRPBCC domain-containing protein [Polyangiaceae bacterium]|nr:SRPBCC domain-containing protein [Polyangiaceae bacterium]